MVHNNVYFDKNIKIMQIIFRKYLYTHVKNILRDQ